jgi:acetyltransferase-like isoleucine patch superfamily enzyme
MDFQSGYIRYLEIASLNNHYPVFPCDVFDVSGNHVPDACYTSSLSGSINISLHRWVTTSKISLSGSGSASIMICFGANVKNLNIHVESGHLFLLVGPHSTIENTVFQSSGINNSIYIGAHVTCNQCSFLSQGDENYILVGHDCMMSTGVHIRNSDSHSIYSYDNNLRINQDMPVIIGDHCWIGRNVILGKGVNVADDIVIGQASLVAKSLTEMHAIYAGIPAKKLKNNTTWDRSRSVNTTMISNTLADRPKQLMRNSFLLNQKPTLPVPYHHELDLLHAKFSRSKDYPWISFLFSS